MISELAPPIWDSAHQIVAIPYPTTSLKRTLRPPWLHLPVGDEDVLKVYGCKKLVCGFHVTALNSGLETILIELTEKSNAD